MRIRKDLVELESRFRYGVRIGQQGELMVMKVLRNREEPALNL